MFLCRTGWERGNFNFGKINLARRGESMNEDGIGMCDLCGEICLLKLTQDQHERWLALCPECYQEVMEQNEEAEDDNERGL